jgi:hypothetical protein
MAFSADGAITDAMTPRQFLEQIVQPNAADFRADDPSDQNRPQIRSFSPRAPAA